MPGKEKPLSNYLPVSRKIFEHQFWTENRPFSKFEAWLDLIQSARFEMSEGRMLIGNKMIIFNRGQFPVSVRFLATRWRWSKNKAFNFLQLLTREGMIKMGTQEGTAQTIITLCNYEDYNQNFKKSGQQTGQDRDSSGTRQGQDGDKTNKENKVNKEKNVYVASAHTYTDEEKTKFKKFEEWISKHAPRVAEMKEPFAIHQFFQVKEKFSSKQVEDLLKKMHNWEPLHKKNRCAYLTLINWARKDEERNFKSTPLNGAATIKDEIYQARKKEIVNGNS